MATVLFVFNVLTLQNKKLATLRQAPIIFEIGLAPDMPVSGNPWPRRLIGDGRDGGGEASSAACVLLPSPEPAGSTAPHPGCRQSLAVYLCPGPPGSSSLSTSLLQPLLAGVILPDTAP